MVTTGATANTTKENSRASIESGVLLLCSHSHAEATSGESDTCQTSIASPLLLYKYAQEEEGFCCRRMYKMG